MVIYENIDIDKAILENFDINIDKAIHKNIDMIMVQNGYKI